MEEEITNMIKKHFYSVDGTPEKAAKEISEMFERFMEWAANSCDTSFDGQWLILEDQIYLSHKQLFSYWNTNINGKSVLTTKDLQDIDEAKAQAQTKKL